MAVNSPVELSVLLIESNKADAETIMQFLRPANGHSFTVTRAITVEQAIKLLTTNRYNVIVLDLCVGVCQECKGIEPLIQLNGEVLATPVVVLTERPDEVLGYQAIQLGAQEHLAKIGMTQASVRKAIVHAFERHRLLDSLRTDSMTDELTKLYNRRGFSMLAQQALKTAKRLDSPASLLFIDMDNLKVINDKYGHEAGDEAIKELAQALKDTFRECDTLARLGGDEFAVFAINADTVVSENLVQRLTRLLSTRARPNREWGVSVSIGIASCNTATGHNIQDMLSVADQKMYQAKQDKKRQAA